MSNYQRATLLLIRFLQRPRLVPGQAWPASWSPASVSAVLPSKACAGKMLQLVGELFMGLNKNVLLEQPFPTIIIYYTSMVNPLYEQLVDGDYHWNAETYDLLEQQCPFGKKIALGRWLVCHLYPHDTCCFFALVSSPSINQPTNWKRTSMYGVWGTMGRVSIRIPFIQPLIEVYSYEKCKCM